MPDFPEQCYQFTRPQDVVSQQLEVVRRSESGTLPASALCQLTGSSVLYRVPNDRSFLIVAWSLFHEVQGADLTYSVGAWLELTQGGSLTPLKIAPWWPGNVYSGTYEAERCYGWTGNLLVPPGVGLSVAASFTPSANVGNLIYALLGYSIPRGNVTEG